MPRFGLAEREFRAIVAAPLAIDLREGRSILLLLIVAWTPSAFAANRVALVICISDYQSLAKRNNPVPDAKAIAASLKSHGFEVTEYYDLPRAELLDAIEEFIP